MVLPPLFKGYFQCACICGFIVILTFQGQSEEAQRPETKQSVADLIKQLGNDDFDLRESATAEIKNLGESCVPALQAALAQTKDLETTNRIESLLRLWPLGGIMWQSDVGVFFGHPIVVGERLYVVNKDFSVYCLNADSGAVQWSVPTGDLMYHTMAYEDGRLYVIRTRKEGRKDGTLFCLNAKDGSTLWQYKFEVDTQTFTAPLTVGGHLYIANENTLYCMDSIKGTVEWRFEGPQTWLSAPTLIDGKLLIGSLDHKLYCVSANDGKELWDFETGGSVYAGAAAEDGFVYLASHDHNIYCLDLKEGKKVWEFETGGCVAGAPAVSHGRIYGGSDDGSFYCLDARDGKKIWQFQTAGNVFTSPAISDGQVFVPSLSNKLTLYCLSTEDAKVHWTFETSEGGYTNPVLARGHLYVGYHSRFYCVRTGLKGPENWPTMSGNPARTGCNN